MRLAIRMDTRDAQRLLGGLSRQLPFAIAQAVRALGLAGQQAAQQHVAAAFTLRRPDFIRRTIKVLAWPNKGAPVMVVGIDPTRDVLAKFEEGGRKTPSSGRALAVPIAVKRTKSDLVVKSMRVRELQLRAHRTRSGAVQLKGLRRTFAVKGPTGGAILQRVGRKPRGRSLSEEIAAGSVRVAYAFKRSVPIPASLQFHGTFQRAADEWPRFMEAAWAQALATAR